jgi:hypothetical protein
MKPANSVNMSETLYSIILFRTDFPSNIYQKHFLFGTCIIKIIIDRKLNKGSFLLMLGIRQQLSSFLLTKIAIGIIVLLIAFSFFSFNPTQLDSYNHAHALQLPRLNLFDPVVSILDDDNLAIEWQFNGQAHQIISLVATRRTGDIDPVITLFDSEGDIVASNDNATFDDQTARLEAVTLPQDDVYTVRVNREGMEYGSTSGQFELILLNGLSVFDNSEAITRVLQLDQGSASTQRTLSALPTPNFFATLQLLMPPSAVPYTLEWVFRDATNTDYKWVFHFTTDGDYVLSIQNAQDEVLRSITGNAANRLPTSGESASLAFWANHQTFSIFVDNQQIDTLTIADSLIPTLTDIMTVSLSTDNVWDETSSLIVSIQNLWITSLFYELSPNLLGAIQPTTPGERIYTTTPQDILEELRTLDLIPSLTPNAGIQARIDSGYVYSEEAGFNAFTLVERRYQNLVLGYTSNLVLGEPTTACGVIFRQNDDANFATVLITPEQGLYFLQYTDGVPNPDGISTTSSAILPGIGAENNVIIVALDAEALLFVNGRLMGKIDLAPLAGVIWAHVVLPTHASAYCQIDDLWVWTP